MASNQVILSSEGLYPQDKRPDRELINLAMGILTQAVRDLFSPKKRVEKDWREWQADSRLWFISLNQEAGSFRWVCEVLGTDPDRLRDAVRKLHALDEQKLRSTILSLVRLTYLGNRTSSISYGATAESDDDGA